MLEARGLTKYYSAITGVRDVNFQVRPGSVLGLLGPNGSGKSTTVGMLTGLLEPSGGTVSLDGADIRADLIGYKRRLGYVPEEAQLYTWMSGAEYLTFCARLRGLPAAVIASPDRRAAAIFGLQTDKDAPMSAYSKGMRQKILISAALRAQPVDRRARRAVLGARRRRDARHPEPGPAAGGGGPRSSSTARTSSRWSSGSAATC